MLTGTRWTVEVALMKRYFPSFSPFEAKDGSVGFLGQLRGPRTARKYKVIVKVPARSYPEIEPAVYIHPRIGNAWMADKVNHEPYGRLSYLHSKPWTPSRNTFANCVVCALAYLEAYDA